MFFYRKNTTTPSKRGMNGAVVIEKPKQAHVCEPVFLLVEIVGVVQYNEVHKPQFEKKESIF